MAAESVVLLESVRQATAGEYTIRRELGRGAMAVVYLADDIALDRSVAIKVMLPDFADASSATERFMVEARTAAKLDHSGIVPVYSVKQSGAMRFIVMKYVDGRTLESILEEQPIPPQDVAASIISQVADALYFAHCEGVIHRDIKPSNILVDTRGRPVIADFGIAKATAAPALTTTGMIMGTPLYMSPEQCAALPATAGSDQYALGVMSYQLFAGRLPFGQTSMYAILAAHINETPEPLSVRRADIDPVVSDTVARMLSKDPRDRFPSMADVTRVFSEAAMHPRGAVAVIADLAARVRAEVADVSHKSETVHIVDPAAAPTMAIPADSPPSVVNSRSPDYERTSRGESPALGRRETWRAVSWRLVASGIGFVGIAGAVWYATARSPRDSRAAARVLAAPAQSAADASSPRVDSPLSREPAAGGESSTRPGSATGKGSKPAGMQIARASSNASPAVTAPPMTKADSAAAHALTCTSPHVSEAAVNAAISGEAAPRLLALYAPRDAADRDSLRALSALVHDAQRLHGTVRTLRSEALNESCDWVMALELSWTNAFGQPRGRTLQIRAELEAVGGSVRVKRLFTASGF